MGEEKKVVAKTSVVARSVTGTVVSNKMDKTITLRVERRVKHPVYGKFVRKSKKIHAHDAKNVCSIGDVVTVEECRPLSKTKSWMLKNVEVKASEV
jgi:small subunit ribosomal protein S17